MKDITLHVSNDVDPFLLNRAFHLLKGFQIRCEGFPFHYSIDGAKATSIVMSLVETAKANNLNAYKYLYTLFLHMLDYKDKLAGIEQLLP